MAKILIVEDNQGTNKAICEYMKEAGHMLSPSEIITAITDRTIGKIPLNNLFDFFQ